MFSASGVGDCDNDVGHFAEQAADRRAARERAVAFACLVAGLVGLASMLGWRISVGVAGDA